MEIISVNEVAKCLVDLDITKACGPDGFPARLLEDTVKNVLMR